MPTFPPFSLERLLKTVFDPKKGEKVVVLIDLDDPNDVVDYAFAKSGKNPVQKKAYEVFYQELKQRLMQKLGLERVDLFAYQKTGGSNLELPATARSPEGKIVNIKKEIYPNYDIILCITNYSATAPLTAAAKQHGFRGATMHGVNDIILRSGLAVDYNEVSKLTEKLRQGMTEASSADITFSIDGKGHQLHIELGEQDAQKSHGLCRNGPDVVNLPAGEVYFVPTDACGSFPMKFDDGTLAWMEVQDNAVTAVHFLRGNKKIVEELQHKIAIDPASGILGELGFGTQVLPYANSDIQDEKIFGTFHLAIGRNDHLHGDVTLNRFHDAHNATHEDILFSPDKTPEIQVKEVRLNRNGKAETVIADYKPGEYLLGLIQHKDTKA